MVGDKDEGAVIGGYPELLDGGRRVGDLLVSESPAFAASRHPRTAVGVGPRGDVLWMVVVDGRQGEYSLGMTLPELAAVFEALGVTEALNLDGGGSSVMVVRGRTLNRPSEGGEREVVNALSVREDTAFCGDRR
jgi:exopolysaccharide biosynthesis protein